MWVHTHLCEVTVAREVSRRAGAAALQMCSHLRARAQPEPPGLRGDGRRLCFVQHLLHFLRGSL